MVNPSSSQAATLAASFALSAVVVMPARARDASTDRTYPCPRCSNMDCHEVEANSISERPDGYVVRISGAMLAYHDRPLRDSLDGECGRHAQRAGTHAGVCLFVPPKGF